MTDRTPLVLARHTASGEVREVPSNWLGDGSPFPGQWERHVEETPASKTPARNASKADWAEFAISQGMTPEEADAATRDDLAAHYSTLEA